jgi:hypothetical protein
VEAFKQDRAIIELPVPLNYKAYEDYQFKWFEQLERVFFYKSQKELFDCFLIMMNKEVFVSYNFNNTLSFNFSQFILKNLPKNIRDQKKRFYHA